MKRGFYTLIILIGIAACSPRNVQRQGLILTELSHQNTDSLTTIIGTLLTDFRVEFLENYVELAWETVSEDSVVFFEIEKAVDTLEFETILTTEPFGDMKGASYVEIDQKPDFNTSLKYRLKIITKSGVFYSDHVEIVIEKPVENIGMLTHPGKNKKYLQFEGLSDGNARLNLFRADGSLAYGRNISVQKGRNEIEIPLKSHPIGLYFIQFKAPGKEWNARMVKPAI